MPPGECPGSHQCASDLAPIAACLTVVVACLNTHMPGGSAARSNLYVLNTQTRQQTGMGDQYGCSYCDRPLPENETHHSACADEWDRRLAAGDCTVCGKRKAAKSNNWCAECIADGGSTKHHGYPPGGA